MEVLTILLFVNLSFAFAFFSTVIWSNVITLIFLHRFLCNGSSLHFHLLILLHASSKMPSRWRVLEHTPVFWLWLDGFLGGNGKNWSVGNETLCNVFYIEQMFQQVIMFLCFKKRIHIWINNHIFLVFMFFFKMETYVIKSHLFFIVEYIINMLQKPENYIDYKMFSMILLIMLLYWK